MCFSFLRIRSSDCEGDCFDIIAEPANFGATLAAPYSLSKISNKYRSGVTSIALLEDFLFTIPVAVAFPYFSPLVETFNEKIHQLLAGGFITHWYSDIMNPKGFTIKPEEIGPQVLTMDHVTIGFLFCLFPLMLGFVAFICELAIKSIAVRGRKFKIIKVREYDSRTNRGLIS